MYGELFVNIANMKNIYKNPHPQQVQQDMIVRYVENGFDNSNKTINQFLDDIYGQNDEFIGFKLLYPHLKRKEGKNIINYIQNNNIFKIILYRENKMNQVLSAFTNRKEESIKVNPKVVLEKIRILIQEEKKFHNIFCNGNYVKKSYESLTGNRDMNQLDFSWIDKKLGIVDVPLRKYKNKGISNIEEIKNLINKSKII